MTNTGNYQKLVKLINKASYRHSAWKIFSDFVEVSAIALSNSVDLINKEAREKRYLEIINSYNKEDQALFPEMFAELTMALEKEVSGNGPTDVLGNLFHELSLHNKWKGQFFTPTHVSEAMGMMVVPDKEELIKEKGFIKVAEPSAGSGSMIIGLANALKSKGIDYTSKIVVTATDIDEKCVHMAYIQLSLYGIPAVIIHGNSITMEEWSKWYTPAYVLGGWAWKKQEMESKNQPTADFIRIQVWGKMGENSANYLAKGRLVAVQGSIQTSSYEDKDGKRVYTTEINARNVEFLEWGNKEGQGNNDIHGFTETDMGDIPF